jgi:hypothetical protein
MMNTENKAAWVVYGRSLEFLFVEKARQLKLDAAINPEKTTNPYVPDLIVNGRLADLKSQRTPFFTASMYGVSPSSAVTFNLKDFERYRAHYPELDIYFWIDWRQTREVFGGTEFYVPRRKGVWRAAFRQIENCIEWGIARLHEYERRKEDVNGNAKASYVLDINWFTYLGTCE